MEEKIIEVLKENLPEQVHDTIRVRPYKILGIESIAIEFAAGNYQINGVEGQRPQAASLSLKPNTMELKPQGFGGNGGQRLYFKVLPEDDTYNALHGVRIPFRKPKPNEDAVSRAIGRFASRWTDIVRDNANRLRYTDEVDYSWI